MIRGVVQLADDVLGHPFGEIGGELQGQVLGQDAGESAALVAALLRSSVSRSEPRRRLRDRSAIATCERHHDGRVLDAGDIAIGIAHRDQADLVRAALARTGRPYIAQIAVDTANRLQGREFEVVIVAHPLSGRRDATAFHLEARRLCVLTSVTGRRASSSPAKGSPTSSYTATRRRTPCTCRCRRSSRTARRPTRPCGRTRPTPRSRITPSRSGRRTRCIWCAWQCAGSGQAADEEMVCEFPSRIPLLAGAASGIGRTTVLLLASRGAYVVVNDLFADGAAAVEAEISALGGSAESAAGDVTRTGFIDSLL